MRNKFKLSGIFLLRVIIEGRGGGVKSLYCFSYYVKIKIEVSVGIFVYCLYILF